MKRVKAPVLGPRILEARKRLRYSLDGLAERSGVSKSMVSQIERGETNPTFATLWNLTQALGIDFSDLVAGTPPDQKPAIELIGATGTPEIKTANGRCVLRILSPPSMAGVVEWYELVLFPGGFLESRPHAKGATEHLTITEGSARITSGSDVLVVGHQETARYRADLSHKIENVGQKVARAFLVVHGTDC